MKVRNFQIILVAVLAFTIVNTATAQLFSARLDDSRWHSVAGNGACHLSHNVSRFGLALITERPGNGLSATVLSQRGPIATRRGQATGINPAWKPETKRPLFTVTAQSGPTVLRLNAVQTTQTLETLESGNVVRFHFDTWQADSAAIDLSPVGFRSALRDHMTCMTSLSGSTPPKTESQKPRATATGAEPLTTAAASAEIEQLAPPPQFTIHFASDSASLDKPDYDTLKAAASAFSTQPFWSRILVTGHADRSGAAAYNRHLALLRAIEIRNRLVRLGVDKTRVKVRTAGEDQPVAEARDEPERAANRRVEIQALL